MSYCKSLCSPHVRRKSQIPRINTTSAECESTTLHLINMQGQSRVVSSGLLGIVTAVGVCFFPLLVNHDRVGIREHNDFLEFLSYVCSARNQGIYWRHTVENYCNQPDLFLTTGGGEWGELLSLIRGQSLTIALMDSPWTSPYCIMALALNSPSLWLLRNKGSQGALMASYIDKSCSNGMEFNCKICYGTAWVSHSHGINNNANCKLR